MIVVIVIITKKNYHDNHQKVIMIFDYQNGYHKNINICSCDHNHDNVDDYVIYDECDYFSCNVKCCSYQIIRMMMLQLMMIKMMVGMVAML